MSHGVLREPSRDMQPPSPSRMQTTPASEESYRSTKKSLQFWLVFRACFVVHMLRISENCALILVGTSTALFLSALELTSVGTALPTIVKDLQGVDFIWIGSAYALCSAAFMPAAGGLSNIFGRRVIMLGSIAIFAAGSAIGGAAQSMNMLIVGRGEHVFLGPW